jgi:replicative DNA helicase
MIDYSRLVFTPLEASNAAETYVDWRRSNSGGGMPLYIPSLEFDKAKNNGFLPVLPGELISVIGRPGNGKTGFMFRWARERASWLHAQGLAGNELAKNSVVLYISLEQTVEELRLFHMAANDKVSVSNVASGDLTDEQWDGIKYGLRNLHAIPLWFIGRSMKRRKDKIELTSENIHSAIETVEKWQDENLLQSVDSIFIDYLQKFRPNSPDFVTFYSGLTNYLKEWASDFMTRIVLGVQAKREVDQRAVQIPMMDDGQWSSTIEQFSDGVISVVRPSHYKKNGEDFGGVVVDGRRQMLISVLKRKMGPESFNGWVSFRPEYNQLDDLELKNFKPNEDV